MSAFFFILLIFGFPPGESHHINERKKEESKNIFIKHFERVIEAPPKCTHRFCIMYKLFTNSKKFLSNFPGVTSISINSKVFLGKILFSKKVFKINVLKNYSVKRKIFQLAKHLEMREKFAT